MTVDSRSSMPGVGELHLAIGDALTARIQRDDLHGMKVDDVDRYADADVVLALLLDRPDLLLRLLRDSEHAVELSPRRVYIGSACDEFKAQMRAGQGWHGFLVKVPASGESTVQPE